MTIKTISDIAAAYENGRYWSGHMYKVFNTNSNGGQTLDLSYTGGVPLFNYYASAPLTSAILESKDGIFPGPSVNSAGYTKYLHQALLMPPNNQDLLGIVLYVHDIVMYYPFVDGDGGFQAMTNSIPIPRYNGVGCKIMITSQGVGVAATNNVFITYTNTEDVQNTINVRMDGTAVAGRLAISNDTISAATTANLQTASQNPYYNLVPGDVGIKRIDSIDIQSPIGGIFAVSIVKPLCIVSAQNQTAATFGTLGAPIEVDYARDRLMLPVVQDGAVIQTAYRGNSAQTRSRHLFTTSFIWG